MSLEFLEETLKLAGAELIKRFGGNNNVRQKADSSLVTDADLASEKVVIDRIKKFFPNDIIFSEESGLSSLKRDPGTHVWIIDPLDGTTNFANDYPFFCVSIGRGMFNERGEVKMQLGGITDPTKAKTYLAEQGKGATLNGSPMSVTKTKDVAKSFLVTGFYYAKGQKLSAEIDKFKRVAEVCSSIRRDGAAALDMALVAEGVFDAFWELGLQPWDVAAGSVLVQEAKGLVLNYTSSSESVYNIEHDGVIAGSHDIVRELRQLFKM